MIALGEPTACVGDAEFVDITHKRATGHAFEETAERTGAEMDRVGDLGLVQWLGVAFGNEAAGDVDARLIVAAGGQGVGNVRKRSAGVGVLV